ncbi:MAG: protein-methionine-sulfoxide reductase heme-binding subunit MsrQ [Paracoccaceae bacterium]
MNRLNRWARRVPTGVVYFGGLIPLVWIVWLTVAGTIGADPVKEIEHRLGLLGLQFLLASLCVTPLRWGGLNLLKFRRALGLLTFLYVALHLVAWIVLDMGLRWSEMGADLVKRPYIIVGMLGFLALVPLAVTSNRASIRAMGAGWGRLHRLAYAAVLLGALHFLILVKAWPAEPILYTAGAVLLVAARPVHRAWKRREKRVATAVRAG